MSKPYGLQKGGKPVVGVVCCPGHTPWPVQSKYANNTVSGGGRRAGRQDARKRARRMLQTETLELLREAHAEESDR